MAKKIARLAALPEDYKRLGLSKEPALWEDGHRTKAKFGSYEWWYFDGKMDDGSSLVIVYYTQPVTAIAPSYAPSVTFSLTKDGKRIQDSVTAKIRDCAFDRAKCNVKVGNSFCRGDLKNYELHYESDRVQADVTLKASADSWRPETGHFRYKYVYAPGYPPHPEYRRG